MKLDFMRITTKRLAIAFFLIGPLYCVGQDTFSDNFGSVSYSNNDGTQNWSAAWQEANDNNSPTNGRIRITGGEVRFQRLNNSRNISRVADLSSYTSATLEFDWRTSSMESGETLAIQVSSDGLSFTTLTTFTGSQSNSFSQDISSYMSANTTIRFIQGGSNWSQGNDRAYIDNVVITATVSSSDNDNDGIIDEVDLDDDNDGILDLDEGDCAGILNNPSTESPLLSGSTPFLASYDSGNIKTYNSSNVPFWETTATDNAIEIWGSSNTLTSPHADAHSGNQFMELNANQVASSYQDVATTPGTTINWSIAHRGRSGTDNATVSIGAPGSVSVVETMSTDNTAWVVYSGIYVVPAGQTVTRFQFDSLGGGSSGNFIDTFTLSCVDASDTDNDGIYDYLDLDSDNDGIYDIVESGVLNETGVNDVNNDGVIDGLAADFGSNGLFNGIEDNDTVSASLTYSPSDTDTDGSLDAVEIDSDNDSCSDVIEAGFTDDNSDGLLGPLPVTVDGNGVVTSGSDGYSAPSDNDSNTTFDFQEAGSAPSITSQPIDVTICPGCSGSITVISTGDTFQWQLFDGSLWNDLSDSGIYSGTSTSTLNINNPTGTENGNQYRVVVANNSFICGDTNSNTAELTVRINTIITNRRITYRVNN